MRAIALRGPGHGATLGRTMMRSFLLGMILLLVPAAWAGERVRSYVFTAIVPPHECDVLPQKSIEIPPGGDRADSSDRVAIDCDPTNDGHTMLKLTFLLTDSPPALEPGQSHRYRFRWGAKLGEHANAAQGEFTHGGERCRRIVDFLLRNVAAQDPAIGPKWAAGCYSDDRWGTSMEIMLTEFSR